MLAVCAVNYWKRLKLNIKVQEGFSSSGGYYGASNVFSYRPKLRGIIG